MDAESLRIESRARLEESRSAVTALLNLDEGSPYRETIQAVDRVLQPLNGIEGRAQLFSKVHPDAEVREVGLEVEQEISAWVTELSLHRGIYDRLVALEDQPAPGPNEARILELTLQVFRRAGVDRDEATRNRVKELKDQILRIGQEFDRNIIEGGRDFRVADGHAGLAGLPADFLASHPEADDGSVTLSSDPQDRIPVLTFAESSELRRDYYHTFMNRAAPENLEVLARLFAKRHELATLLGFDHWADFITEDKMARTADEVRGFVGRVIALSRARGEVELEELEAEKKRWDPNAEGLREWERAFLMEKIKQRRFDFDSQSVRPYFPYSRVRDGVLETSAEVYGVEFRSNREIPVWHESVECYDVVDGGEVVARFYLDMHPRENKYKHAAMFGLTAGQLGERLPEAALVCNFPEPKNGDPALLLRDQVRTLFHEFGHLLHHLFARQPYVRLSALTCEWDFVEVPSQLFEEWVWDYDQVLSRFARHYETDEPMPLALATKMREASEYGKGLNTLTQMFLATLSLTYHDRDPKDVDLMDHFVRIKQELVPFPHEEGTHFIASFGHLNGYSAMYYTYMWSLVIAKDLFSRFEGNLFNREIADDYRRTVLSRGGARPARELVQDFLGRDYEFSAFERWLNT